MLVLHVLGELRHSGAETMLCAAGPLFAERGVEGDILSTGDQVGSLAPKLATAGYRIHHAPFARTPRYFVRVGRLMRAGRYDIIHLHTERANFWFGLVALAARPRRVLRTIHNVFSFDGALRRRRGAQRRILHRLGVTHVACSASVQRNEGSRFGLETVLAPNWYDSRRFHVASDEQRSDAKRGIGVSAAQRVLVSVGNCSDVKNHAALIAALGRLAHVDGVVYLHAGAEQPGQPERSLAHSLGIDERVRFLGSVDDMPALFAASDVFVMPSLYEGFPIAVLEALGSGVPAVISDVPGLSDFRQEYPDLVFAEPTADALVRALESMLGASDVDTRARSAEYAEVTRKSYGLEAGVERYVRLYER